MAHLFSRAWRRIEKYQQQAQVQRLSIGYHIGPRDYRRIYHYHIPKTGGTSINRAFLELSGWDAQAAHQKVIHSPNKRAILNGKIYIRGNTFLLNEGYFYYGFSHDPMYSLNLPQEGTYTFTCLRDPAKRILSYFKERLWFSQNDRAHIHYQTVKEWFSENFGEFLERAPKNVLMAQLNMFSAEYAVDEAYANILTCSHFFFTEDFEAGLARLSADLDVPLVIKHERKAKIDFTPSAQEMEQLNQMLAPEFTLYNRVFAARQQITPVTEA